MITRLKTSTLIISAAIGALGVLGTLGASLAIAGTLDYTGEPPPTDPSAYTIPPADLQASSDALMGLPEANEGALELADHAHAYPRTENTLQPADQSSYNYPTNGYPSPLYGAKPFSQQVILFEEFGPEKLDPAVVPTKTFPRPALSAYPGDPELDSTNVARSGPEPGALEAFLGEPGLAPFPTREANTLDTNPWRYEIEQFLNRKLVNAPAEGRPPGEGWAHQRWNEFYPQIYFKTAMMGVHENYGFRDSKQSHGYAKGEFAPGGLYHNVAGIPATEGTTEGAVVRFHPNMPIQDHKTIWTFDGTLPPKLLKARYGQPLLMRHYNALPIDPQANRGFGLHTISTHEHNGHSPAESDGFANAFFFPGQFYDYRWPMQLAGYDSINTEATDPRAAFPCDEGEKLWVNDKNPGWKECKNGKINIRGDWRETMSTHWFHDHMLDFTAQNVYKGNAAMMNYYSAIDRGNEAFDDGVNLRFPSGTADSWGNRDYDINLVIADKAWDKEGQLWFNPFNLDGFIGDQMLVNWLYKPYMEVRARKYRFRLLNGSVSRYFTLALVRERNDSKGEMKGPRSSGKSYDRVPFHLIANDGNILEHAVPFDGTMDLDYDGQLNDHKGQLPTQAIAERWDIIVDFSKHGIKPGDKLYFVNVKEHDTGKGSKRDVPLAEVLSESYKAVLGKRSDGSVRWENGDPVVGRFFELRVAAMKPGQVDLSMDPTQYEPAKPGKAAGKKMIPLWLDRTDPAAIEKIKSARHREFIFGRSSGTDSKPWTVKTDGGSGIYADPRRISAAPQLATGPTEAGFSGDGTLEVWKIVNGGNGWGHPVHVHFEEGIVLQRGGKTPPEWEKWARKDVYRVGEEDDSTSEVEIAIQFREFAGTYVEHCHNTQHEDNAMLLRWDLEHPGQFTLMPTPMPTWDGVEYAPSAALPTFRSGMGYGADYLNGGVTDTQNGTTTTTGTTTDGGATTDGKGKGGRKG